MPGDGRFVANDPRRHEGRKFAPNIAHNPGGLTKEAKRQITEIKDLARSYAPAAIRRLADLMENADNDGVCKAACDSILDRAFGKPAGHLAVQSQETRLQLNITPKDLIELANQIAEAEGDPILPMIAGGPDE